MFSKMLQKMLGILSLMLALGVLFSPIAKAESAEAGSRLVYCYDNYGQILAYGVERDFAGTERDFAGGGSERDIAGTERDIARGVERDYGQDPGSVSCYVIY